MTTGRAPAAILVAVQSSPPTAPISPETVSQAVAGALLVTVAAVELWLSFWAAGWWHRGGASLVAVAGAALLARAVAVVFLPPRRQSARRAARSVAAAPGVMVAELAHR